MSGTQSTPIVLCDCVDCGGDSKRPLCIICTEPLGVHSDTIMTLPCGHPYHRKCVEQWLNINPTCPQCKHKVPGHAGYAGHDANVRRAINPLLSARWMVFAANGGLSIDSMEEGYA
jgi:hypothetical protein